MKLAAITACELFSDRSASVHTADGMNCLVNRALANCRRQLGIPMHKTFIVALSVLAVTGASHAFAGSAVSGAPGIIINNGHGKIATPAYTPPPATPSTNLANAKQAYADAQKTYAAAVTNLRQYEVNGHAPGTKDPTYAAYQQAKKASVDPVEAYKLAEKNLKKAETATPPSVNQIASQNAHAAGAAVISHQTGGAARSER
jgi:hypothetical protein